MKLKYLLPLRLFCVLIITASLVVLSSKPCFSLPADVEDISNRDYYQAVLGAINKAQKEIIMAMYLVSYQPDNPHNPVTKLLESLVTAKERGVKIRIILEYDWLPEGEKRASNMRVYEYLRSTGIDAFLDTAGPSTHAKAIVIDQRTVILGSSNWSQTALEGNNEINVKIDSSQLAQSIKDRILKIKTRYIKDTENKQVIWIPRNNILAGGHQTVNSYEFHGLYDLPIAKTRLDLLAGQYGTTYTTAKNYAAIIYKEKSLKDIERIVDKFPLIATPSN